MKEVEFSSVNTHLCKTGPVSEYLNLFTCFFCFKNTSISLNIIFINSLQMIQISHDHASLHAPRQRLPSRPEEEQQKAWESPHWSGSREICLRGT